MASAAKIAANRRNAQLSTGPRSTAAKARTRYNALQHRLNVPARYDQATGEEIQRLAVYLSADAVDPQEQDLAMRAAEAQFDLLRVQRAKVDLINGAAKQLARTDASLPAGERAALAFMDKSKILAAFDRYERRATSRRNRPLRKLRALQHLHRRQEAVEQVGPPRPRERPKGSPFVEDVRRLEIHAAVKAAAETGRKLPTQDGSSLFRIGWRWGPSEKPNATIFVAVRLLRNLGVLTLAFRVNGERVVQNFPLLRVPTRVGGGKWLVQCKECDKPVQDVYFDPGQRRFRSRHALRLHYRSKTLPAWERHWERCEKLMDRLGATYYRDPPPRPKYMRRATYQRLCEEMSDAGLRSLVAHVGKRGGRNASLLKELLDDRIWRQKPPARSKSSPPCAPNKNSNRMQPRWAR